MNLENLIALGKIVDLIEEFTEKNIIRKKKVNFDKIRLKIENLKGIDKEENHLHVFNSILKKLKLLIKREVLPNIFFIFGAHGGVIINNIGFCEFDSPKYALDTLIQQMQLAFTTNMPYNLEIAICCLEWMNNKFPYKFSKFKDLFNSGRFEIINPTYSQPYNLIIGPESNLKQFEYGLKFLQSLGIKSPIYYCSESSLHPQIPQILKKFNINFGSLRTRLLGLSPTSNSAHIKWIGLDNTAINAMIDQSGVFNGEYFHGTFFKELPNLLFQAVARPYMDYIVYSSIEDFINPHPFQKDVWNISKFTDLFGKFLLCSELFNMIEKNGEYKYKRDDFFIGDYLFVLPELFLQNKKSEINLISAEIINYFLSLFNDVKNDSFFDVLWKRLLLAQSHDCFVVPFIRTGDYTISQLNKDEYNKLDLKPGTFSISELSIQIHKEIQDNCKKFINKSLDFLLQKLSKGTNKSKNSLKTILVINPTPYDRREIIKIPIKSEEKNLNLTFGKNKDNYYNFDNSNLKLITEIPSFGYRICIIDKNDINPDLIPEFLFNLTLSKDQKNIDVKFGSQKVFSLKFDSQTSYILELKEHQKDNVEEKKKYIGRSSNNEFEIELIQYNGINRLEINLEATNLREIILVPNIKINRTIINYPFGIEETKRTTIQTLDFIWLRGSEQSIIYIQKNSQKFKINRENFEIHNHLTKNGRYEYAISITDENNLQSPLYYAITFYFKLLGIIKKNSSDFEKKSGSFIRVDPPIYVSNLWKRNNHSFIRLFNPNNNEINIKLEGKSLAHHLKEISFNYNEISLIKSYQIKFKPWEIKTLKF